VDGAAAKAPAVADEGAQGHLVPRAFLGRRLRREPLPHDHGVGVAAGVRARRQLVIPFLYTTVCTTNQNTSAERKLFFPKSFPEHFSDDKPYKNKNLLYMTLSPKTYPKTIYTLQVHILKLQSARTIFMNRRV